MKDQLPNKVEMERGILASLLMDPVQYLPVAMERLSPESFYSMECREFYEILLGLQAKNAPIDTYTVFQASKAKGISLSGGFFQKLMENEWPVALNFRHYCQEVNKTADLRRFWAKAQEVGQACLDPFADPEEVKQLADAAFVLSEDQKDYGLLNAGALADEVVQQATDERAAQRGLITPWSQFNRLTKGLQPQNLIIVAARPGVGKSAWAINLSECIAASGRPVAFFSLEMSSKEVIRRILAGRTGIPALEILDGGLAEHDKASLRASYEQIKGWPLSIDDGGGLSVPMIRAKAKKIKAQHGLSLVVVDYVQLLKTPKADRRDLEIGLATKELKYLAKELDVPVVALAQINRQAEQQNRRPRLSDLRESGSLEQDTDIVCFLHPEQVFEPGQQRPTTQNILMDVAKHRNGQPDIIEMQFHGPTTTYTERART